LPGSYYTHVVVVAEVVADADVAAAEIDDRLVGSGFGERSGGRFGGEYDAEVVGGRGGGKPTLAQAGGKDPEKLPEAIKTAAKYIQDLLT